MPGNEERIGLLLDKVRSPLLLCVQLVRAAAAVLRDWARVYASIDANILCGYIHCVRCCSRW